MGLMCLSAGKTRTFLRIGKGTFSWQVFAYQDPLFYQTFA